MPAQAPRANNGWYVPGGSAGTCVYIRQDGAGLHEQLVKDGGLPGGSAHRGGGGLRPGNSHPSEKYVMCRAGGSDEPSFCLPPVQRLPFDPLPLDA